MTDTNKKNIRALIEWQIYMLITNIIGWNIMLRVFIFLDFLIAPQLFNSGPRVFQLMSFITVTGTASAIAFLSWFFEDIIFYKRISRSSIGGVFLLRLLFIVLVFCSLIITVGMYHYKATMDFNFREYLQLIGNFILNRITLYLLVIGILISSFISFIKAIRQKVGHENFLKIIAGYYRTPREENRIFIFIDLISSTHYAEKLGHKLYSPFLRECFNGIGLLEIKYRGTQYQFVGDEVVVSWSGKRNKNFQNTIDFFFEFQNALESRAEYFKKKFGVVPRFTASVNSGKIMMAEVGDYKSEIAFHGDVLNTAARIQKQCKCYNKEILVTGRFAEKFRLTAEPGKYQTEFVACEKLEGKKAEVDIYTILPVSKP